MARGTATHVIDRLLTQAGVISTTDVAKDAGISRQAAHRTLRMLVYSGALEVRGRARASRYHRAQLAPGSRCVRLEVASAGSLFRLSARLLLADVRANDITLDFNGVMDVSDEFLEEIFQTWSHAHPTVLLHVINVPQEVEARVFRAAAHVKRLSAAHAEA